MLTLENNKVVIEPAGLMVLPYKEIWNADVSDKKEQALKELAFVYYTCDFKSPYQSYKDIEINDKVKEALGFPEKWHIPERVSNAQEYYKKLQETRSLKFVQGARNAIDKMIIFFENVDFTLLDDKGQPVYKITDLVRTIKDANAMLEGLKKLEDLVKTEIQTKNTARGGFEIGDYED